MTQELTAILENYYQTLTSGVIDYIPKIIGAIVIIWIWFKLVNILATWVEKLLTRQKIAPMLRSFTISFSNMILKVMVLLAATWVLWVQTSSLVAMLAAAGFAIGMALSWTLQNFAGWVMILLLKPFRIGHYVEAGGHAGTVREIGIFNTTLTTTDEKKVFIPNSDISNSATINYSASSTRRVDMVIWISYDDDIDVAKKLLQTIADKDERIIKDKAVTIWVIELWDNSVNLAFRFFVKNPDYWPVWFDTLETVKKTFDKKGVNFPFPQRDVHLYNEK